MANALARLNTDDFHRRNGSLGRPWSEETTQYTLPEHVNMTAECCAIIEFIFESAHAICRVDEGDAEAHAIANDARFDFHFDLFTFIFIMTKLYNHIIFGQNTVIFVILIQFIFRANLDRNAIMTGFEGRRRVQG